MTLKSRETLELQQKAMKHRIATENKRQGNPIRLAKKVECPICHTEAGRPCPPHPGIPYGYHVERLEDAKRARAVKQAEQRSQQQSRAYQKRKERNDFGKQRKPRPTGEPIEDMNEAVATALLHRDPKIAPGRKKLVRRRSMNIHDYPKREGNGHGRQNKLCICGKTFPALSYQKACSTQCSDRARYLAKVKTQRVTLYQSVGITQGE